MSVLGTNCEVGRENVEGMEKVLRDGEGISYGLWRDENEDYVGIARLPDLSHPVIVA